MLAIDLTGTLLARRVRDRDSHTFSIIHEGMQQAGLAGAGGSREDEKDALVHTASCNRSGNIIIFSFLSIA
jgi:hypothetical protein